MSVVRVAVGLILRGDECLIAKRPDHVHQGGRWEFPGGKCESDESSEQALCRELQEELGIVVSQVSPLFEIHHDYPDKSVALHICSVEVFAGEPSGCEGQLVRWVLLKDLSNYHFPDANQPILEYLMARGMQ